MKEAFKDLLQAIIDSETYQELEAGCAGAGPVVTAYEALGEPLPQEIQDWFNWCDETVDEKEEG